jgi:hypothetical protein
LVLNDREMGAHRLDRALFVRIVKGLVPVNEAALRVVDGRIAQAMGLALVFIGAPEFTVGAVHRLS